MGLREFAETYREIFSANGGRTRELRRRLRLLRMDYHVRELESYLRRGRDVLAARERRWHDVGKMILELRREKQKLEHFANHDVQTGLPNRRVFNHDLEAYLTGLVSSGRVHHVAVLFVALDSTFNRIKQSMGYTISDTLLYITATRIQNRLANLAYRLYQSDRRDEFIVLLETTIGPVECETIAEELHSAIAAPHHYKGNVLRFACHIGIAIFPEHGEEKETLLRNADTAMAWASERGERFAVYEPVMGETVARIMRMERDLRRAIENGAQEFRLLYQPLVNRRGRLEGVEALLRWEHPELGMIGPTRFIPLAEETGLIVPIGHWVLYQACEQLKQWHAKGYRELYVAVNLSARQLEMPQLAEMVLQVVKSKGIDPRFLKIELTESTVMTDPEEALRIIRHLHERRVRIAIDDFGTGYSSLNYLQQFPVDTLKIDQSFVRQMGSSEHIVETIIGMARNMEIESLAEGVETVEQRDYLVSRGCTNMQGYYFSEPVEPATIESYLRAGGVLPLSEERGAEHVNRSLARE